MDKRLVWFLIGATLVGSALRALAATNELWLDEIWSIFLVSGLDGPLGVFTSLHHDNNHYLNSLVLYALGPERSRASYRVLPILAGASSVWLAGIWGARRSVRSGMVAAGFAAVAFLFVQYGSEARGYAYLIPATIAFLIVLERFLETPDWKRGVPLNLAGVMGVISHLTFVFLWAPAVLWTVARGWRRGGFRAAFADAVSGQALTGLVIGIIYLVDVRHMRLYGGPMKSLAAILEQTLSLLLGLTRPGGLRLLLAATVVILVVAMVGWRAFRRREAHLLVLLALSAGLAIWPMLSNEEYAVPRYLLVPMTLLCLLLASWVADRLGERGLPRWIGVVVLVGFVTGNLAADVALIRTGRGGFQAALQRIAESRDRGSIELGSVQDFRAGLMLQFYAPAIEREEGLRFRLRTIGQGRPPNWLIEEQLSPWARPLPASIDVLGTRYRQVARYPHAGLSGLTWTIFGRE